MYGVQGLDENPDVVRKLRQQRRRRNAARQGENFDSIKIRITNCASNLQRARQREARRGQTGQSLFGLFRPEQPALLIALIAPFLGGLHPLTYKLCTNTVSDSTRRCVAGFRGQY